jgi:hypothetical protein
VIHCQCLQYEGIKYQERKMRICKIDNTEQVWGRGGVAPLTWGVVAGSAVGGAAGSAGAAGGSASTAGSAVVGGVAGALVGAGVVALGTTPPGAALVFGAAAGGFVANLVTDSMNSYNQNNPATPAIQESTVCINFGAGPTTEVCVGPGGAVTVGGVPATDPLGNQTGTVDTGTVDTGGDYGGFNGGMDGYGGDDASYG